MDVAALERDIRTGIEAAGSLDDLESARIKFMGRKGVLTAALRGIKDAPAEDRKRLGQEANRLKELFEQLFGDRKGELSAGAPNPLYQAPMDGTLPATTGLVGHHHVIHQTMREMKRILYGMGYSLAKGPDVELDYNNFQALNFPEEHPSRDLQDTFYVTDDVLLRTHTSPVQVRYMLENQPPLKIMAPGRVYRNETIDATHAAEFHQVEGLYVDTDVSLADLRNEVHIFLQQLFGPNTQTRFKPHFFPFTEPSVDVDVAFGTDEHGETQWLEIMGAGMVHPNVFRAVGYDPDQFTGFAFGIGVDRVAMIRHGIRDIRQFLANDRRFLSQF